MFSSMTYGKTPLYMACYKGHYKVVQLLLDHGVQVDAQDNVSDISCIHVIKLCNTTEINETTFVTNKCFKCLIE